MIGETKTATRLVETDLAHLAALTNVPTPVVSPIANSLQNVTRRTLFTKRASEVGSETPKKVSLIAVTSLLPDPHLTWKLQRLLAGHRHTRALYFCRLTRHGATLGPAACYSTWLDDPIPVTASLLMGGEGSC